MNNLIIRPNKIVIYVSRETKEPAELDKETPAFEAKEKVSTIPSGFMNIRIKKAIEKILYNWLEAIKEGNKSLAKEAKRIPVFITLTLPSKQIHSDQFLHRYALGKFIIYMQRQGLFQNYLWRAERQKNGNIHYHIITDQFIEWQKIRATWNEVLNPLGYIDRYNENRVDELTAEAVHVAQNYKEALAIKGRISKSFSHSEQFNNPNSTDIHKLKNISDPAAYVTKYMSKSNFRVALADLRQELENGMIDSEEFINRKNAALEIHRGEKIDGRVWGSSLALKSLQNFSIREDLNTAELVRQLNDLDDTRVFSNEFVTVVFSKKINSVLKSIPALAVAKKEIDLFNFETITSPLYFSPDLKNENHVNQFFRDDPNPSSGFFENSLSFEELAEDPF